MFHAPSLQRDLESIRSLADANMRRLVRRVKLMRWHEDPAFTYFSYLSLWGTLWAMAVEKYRKQLREAIRATAASIGEIEGLSSLAAFSFEHPDYAFPSLVEGANDHAPVFTAVAMGHPLIEPSVCVRNPVSIDSRNRFVLVSGSNMSGKSTYLRSVGLNFVLARAGAPFAATHCR
jgi:DNA mismatch repair ATPase MutS